MLSRYGSKVFARSRSSLHISRSYTWQGCTRHISPRRNSSLFGNNVLASSRGATLFLALEFWTYIQLSTSQAGGVHRNKSLACVVFRHTSCSLFAVVSAMETTSWPYFDPDYETIGMHISRPRYAAHNPEVIFTSICLFGVLAFYPY